MTQTDKVWEKLYVFSIKSTGGLNKEEAEFFFFL